MGVSFVTMKVVVALLVLGFIGIQGQEGLSIEDLADPLTEANADAAAYAYSKAAAMAKAEKASVNSLAKKLKKLTKDFQTAVSSQKATDLKQNQRLNADDKLIKANEKILKSNEDDIVPLQAAKLELDLEIAANNQNITAARDQLANYEEPVENISKFLRLLEETDW